MFYTSSRKKGLFIYIHLNNTLVFIPSVAHATPPLATRGGLKKFLLTLSLIMKFTSRSASP